MVAGFVGEYGEGEGLFGVGRDVKAVGREKGDEPARAAQLFGKSGRRSAAARQRYSRRIGSGPEKPRQQLEKERVPDTAAGDDDLVDRVLRKNETPERVDDRCRRKSRYGMDEIARTGAVAAAQGQQFLDVVRAEVFAAGGFGRLLLQVRFAQKLAHAGAVDAPAFCENRAFVETLAAVCEALDQRVDEHVAGAGVESGDLRGRGVGGNDRDVGDAADVEADAAESGVAVERVVGDRDQRGSLAAESDIGGAEVGNGGDAGTRCDDRAVAELQGRGHGKETRALPGPGLPAPACAVRTLVKNRLA